MFITSSQKFAAWLNKKYPGAYRPLTADDVRDMTACGLIGRYGYYLPSLDGETIRGILQYEQLREKKSKNESADNKLGVLKCKMCGQPLPPEPENKTGRPKEYCSECESLRNKKWQKESRRRRRGIANR